MKDQIKIEEIVGYLPYGLMCQATDQGITKTAKLSAIYDNCTFSFANLIESEHGFDDVKPILHSSPSITEHRDDLGMSFIEYVGYKYPNTPWFQEWIEFYSKTCLIMESKVEHIVVSEMYKHHIDIHNLIPRGLAVDINSLKIEK